MTQFPSPSSVPHIGSGQLKEVEIAGKILHFFVLPESIDGADVPSLFQSIYLQVSEVVQGYPAQSVQAFLAHRRALHHDDAGTLPEFVWLDERREHHAITPICFLDALVFWEQRSASDHWAKLVTKDEGEVAEVVFRAFGWGDGSAAEDSLSEAVTPSFTPKMYRYGPVEQNFAADGEATLLSLQTREGLP